MIRNNLRGLEQKVNASDPPSPTSLRVKLRRVKRLRRAKQTERCGQVRPATVYHDLLRIAHHIQHPVQKQGRPVPHRLITSSRCAVKVECGNFSERGSRTSARVLRWKNAYSKKQKSSRKPEPRSTRGTDNRRWLPFISGCSFSEGILLCPFHHCFLEDV